MKHEREISLISLLLFDLNKWKKILIMVIIGLVLLGGFGLVKPDVNTDSQSETDSKDSDDDIVEEISDEEYEARYEILQTSVESTDKVIESLINSIDGQENYLDESILMQIDPYNKPMAYVTYRFYSNNSWEMYRDPADEIISRYADIFLKGKDLTDISEKYGVNTVYIDELIFCNSNLNANSITLSATGTDENMARDILAVIQQQFEGIITSDMENNNYDISIKKAEEYYAMVIDQELFKNQLKMEEQLTDTLKEIKNLQKDNNTRTTDISELKKAKKEYDEAVGEQNKDVQNGQITNTISIRHKLKQSVKYALVGALLGLVAGILLYSIIFLINPVIMKDRDIAEYYGATILGSFNEKKKGRFAKACGGSNKNVPFKNDKEVLNKITLALQTKLPEADRILLMGSCWGDGMERIAENLKFVLPDISFETVTQISNSTEELKKIIDSRDIILVEKRKQSTLSNIDMEMDVILEYGKNLVGFIME